ncbi:MAG: AtpZ/AtpI family protein [Planctomycetes bacterium]|nr:AtpZ/AtpI family protein [Planctomycetota bacterium]
MWKQAVLYADLVLQFGISVGLSLLLGWYLQEEFGIPWLMVILPVIVSPLSFWRFLKQLEKYENDSQ